MIEAGSYQVAADATVSGTAFPWYELDLEMNVFALGSQLTARGPMDAMVSKEKPALDPSRVTDWSARAQGKTLLPWRLAVGYTKQTGAGSAGSTAKITGGLVALESGYIDETNADYGLNEWELIGRSTSSIFQDNPTADVLPRNIRGSDLVAYFCKKHGIAFQDNAASANVVLGKAFQDANYQSSLRNSTEWDYMQDAALADGVVLSDHLGTVTYGPAGGANPPTIQLDYGSDIPNEQFRVLHAARHSHMIQVVVMGYDHKKMTRVQATYGTSRGDETKFRFWIGTTDFHKARGEAFAIWKELVSKELILQCTLYPDDALMRLIAKQGAGFLVQLGNVVPSHRQLFHVKQVGVKISALGEKPTLKVDLLMENHLPLSEGGSYV